MRKYSVIFLSKIFLKLIKHKYTTIFYRKHPIELRVSSSLNNILVYSDYFDSNRRGYFYRIISPVVQCAGEYQTFLPQTNYMGKYRQGRIIVNVHNIVM